MVLRADKNEIQTENESVQRNHLEDLSLFSRVLKDAEAWRLSVLLGSK